MGVGGNFGFRGHGESWVGVGVGVGVRVGVVVGVRVGNGLLLG